MTKPTDVEMIEFMNALKFKNLVEEYSDEQIVARVDGIIDRLASLTPTNAAKHPMQPVVRAKDGIPRFKENPILIWMLEMGGAGNRFDLNTIAIVSAQRGFKKEDHMQLAQLIGYSTSGYGDLSYASKESIEWADSEAEKIYAKI